MKYADPAAIVDIELPAGWALDPLSSSLFERVFTQWAEEEPRRLFVRLTPTLTHGTAQDWVNRTKATLPPEAPTVEVTFPGPVVWVVRPGREGRPHQRWAIVRGRFADCTLEEVGVPLGGSARTPVLLSAVASLTVPVNERRWSQPSGTWNELMDQAEAAANGGDLEMQQDKLRAAQNWALRSWLESVQDGIPMPDYLIAAAQSRLSLASAAQDADLLVDSVELTHRLASFPHDDPEGLRRLEERLHALCGSAAGQPAPKTIWQAFLMAVGVVVREVLKRKQSLTPLQRRDRAESAMRLTASSLVASQRLHNEDDQAGPNLTALRRLSLTHLAAAGAAYNAAVYETAQVFSPGVAAEWLLAARLLAAQQPDDESARGTLLAALLAARGACTRVGDADSAEQEEKLLAEARSIAADYPNNPLNNYVWLASAWVSIRAGRPEESFRYAGRIQTANDDLARSRAAVEAAALRLLGRHEEELARAQQAVVEGDPSDSTHRVGLALALESAGKISAAVDQALRALRSGLTENPVGKPVVQALLVLAHLHELGEPALSLRLTMLVEDLLDLQSRLLDGPAEAVSFADIEQHREVVADLVVRLINVNELDQALAVAEYARARTRRADFRSVGDRPGPPLISPETASLADIVESLGRYLSDLRNSHGFRQRLDGAALRALVVASGRPTLLLHPSASGLVRFLLMPDGEGHVSVVAEGVGGLTQRIEDLHRALGFELATRTRGEAGAGLDEAALLTALEAWAAEPTPPVIDAAEEPRRSLHDIVFGDLDLPPGPLALVPYRELALVPYPVLLTSGGVPVLDACQLSVLPGITSLNPLGRVPRRGRRRALVVGAPAHDPALGLPHLRHAASEALAVVEALVPVAEVGTPLLGNEADEATFRSQANGAGILHLACHATVGATPADSALYLTPGPADDGAFGLNDAEDLLLDDALVVLAACQTGLGRATPDGVAGLGQAFHRSGARCVVLSLWRVGDASTAALMSEFYRLLVGSSEETGWDVAAALAEAQRRTRMNFPRVAQWGPWLVAGDGGWRLDQ